MSRFDGILEGTSELEVEVTDEVCMGSLFRGESARFSKPRSQRRSNGLRPCAREPCTPAGTDTRPGGLGCLFHVV
jgi:hypothetical protein